MRKVETHEMPYAINNILKLIHVQQHIKKVHSSYYSCKDELNIQSYI